MRFALKKRERGEIEFGVIYGAIAVLAVLAGRFFPLLDWAPACVFRSLLGFPCPTCGSTRSIVHLARGEIAAAISLNPLVGTCVIAAVICLFYSVPALFLGLPRITLVLAEKERDRLRLAAVLLFLLNWVYLFFAL